MVISLKIFYDTKNEFYNANNRCLNRCVTINHNNTFYYYEFMIKDLCAHVKYNDLKFIEEAVNYFHDDNLYIYKYITDDDKYYQEFDKIFTFKLPINILQPSKFFIDELVLNTLEENIDIDDEYYIPVNIIDDEYVILDGHTLLLLLANNYKKMVNVYIADYDEYIPDFVYICKEGNIKNIKNIHVLKHEEYELYWNQFLEQFNIE